VDEYSWLLPIPGTILILFYLFRRRLRQALEEWMKGEEPGEDRELVEILAREKKLMAEEEKDQNHE
jgi:hypothetical protein